VPGHFLDSSCRLNEIMQPLNKNLCAAAVLLAAGAIGYGLISLIAMNHRRSWQGTAQTIGDLRKENDRIAFLAQVLPATATDIHYYTNMHTHYYASFNVTQQEFLAWAAQIESTSIAKDAQGQTIKKLRQVDPFHGLIPLYPEPERGEFGEIRFTAGYYTLDTRTTQLMSVELAYDSDKQRAYLLAKRR
jgi:hypothetical protein